ncbi:response regulator transcription factor [Halosegnis marinus]|uniref:Response regulator n=1 Tax=Halosegnis marinus TaxID=3034023 RepID=A0ABD5ZKV4_9EURY|nr:response regulator transcription factor [Halosegnis sp. DT85]
MTDATDGRPHVLLVEDEPELADLYETWLSAEYEVTTAGDGPTALEAFDASVDVVLLDRRMPGMPGDEVLSVIRETDATARVAMVTAVEPDEDAVDLGFDDYLCKPAGRGDLLALVATLVRRAEYDADARRHFALARKIGLLETHLPARELAESEAYAELKAEFEALDVDLSARLSDSSPEDIRAAIAGR